MASRQAADDVRSLPQLEHEADAAANGLSWAKLGEAYASYGQFDKAVAAYQKGLEKGGLQNPEDTKLHLGIAYLQGGQSMKANETLSSVSGKDGARDLAQLWLLKARSP